MVVNFSGEPADGRVGLGWTDLRGRSWKLTDLLDDRVFEWSGDELADQGLFVSLPPWGCHLLAMDLRTSPRCADPRRASLVPKEVYGRTDGSHGRRFRIEPRLAHGYSRTDSARVPSHWLDC